MPWPYSLIIPGLWGLWLVYWVVASFGAKPTQRAESRTSRLSHLLPLLAGGMLIGLPHIFGGLLDARLVPPAQPWLVAASVLVAFGLGFASLARASLGGNWSGVVDIKAGHELVRSGPYAYVRHPIYSGLLLALLGTALSIGTERALLGMALLGFAFVRRAAIEDRLMAEQFGDTYERYRAEVPAMVPFVY